MNLVAEVLQRRLVAAQHDGRVVVGQLALGLGVDSGEC